MAKRNNVGDFSLNDTVLCHGVKSRIIGFPSRRTVTLENMMSDRIGDGSKYGWSTAKVSIREVSKVPNES